MFTHGSPGLLYMMPTKLGCGRILWQTSHSISWIFFCDGPLAPLKMSSGSSSSSAARAGAELAQEFLSQELLPPELLPQELLVSHFVLHQLVSFQVAASSAPPDDDPLWE